MLAIIPNDERQMTQYLEHYIGDIIPKPLTSMAQWLKHPTYGRKDVGSGSSGSQFFLTLGPGDSVDLFCSVSGWHTTPVARRVGLVLEHFPFTKAASQWLYVNLVC